MIQTQLISHYGGKLVSPVVAAKEQTELRARASHLPSIRISERSACDLKLLACGAFSPLDHFVTKEDHQSILEQMRQACVSNPNPVAIECRPGLASGPGSRPAQCQKRVARSTSKLLHFRIPSDMSLI